MARPANRSGKTTLAVMPPSSYRGIYALDSFLETMSKKVMQRHLSSAVASSRALHRLVAAGILAGLLLMSLAPVLPERVQNPGLFGGIALSLVCMAVALAHPAKDAHLEYRGMSPVIAMLVGLLPLVGITSWHNSKVEQRAIPAPTITLTRAPAPAPLPVQASAPIQEDRRAHASSERARLEPILAELQRILGTKAQPALDSQYQLLTTVNRSSKNAFLRDPGEFRSQLAAAARDLADVQSSLENIKSQNQDYYEELNEVIGDTAALAKLTSGLSALIESLPGIRDKSVDQTSAATSELSELALGLRGDATATGQWINDCTQRIAELRTTLVASG